MMKKIILATVAILGIAGTVLGGERTLPIQTPPRAQLNPGVHFADQDQTVVINVPKFDGRDNQGNVVPFYKLREVKIGLYLDTNTHLVISNTLQQDRGWWKLNIGPYPVISVDNFKDNSDFIPFKKESIAGIGGKSMAAGASVYYPLMDTRLYEFDKYIETPRELRLFCGSGSIPLNLIMSKYEDRTKISGHGWNIQEDLVLNEILNEYTPGYSIAPVVTYIFDDSAIDFVKSKEIRITIPEIWFTQDLPYYTALFDGFNIDPLRITEGKVTFSPNCWYYDGIENVSASPAICGGFTSFACDITVNGKLGAIGGVQRGVGTGNTPLPRFDNILDFEGPSGEETFSAANSSMPTSLPMSISETPWAVCPNDVVGPNKQLNLIVTSNIANYSPFPTFNWWNINMISGEVLIRIWYR